MEGIFTIKDKSNSVDCFLFSFFQSIEMFLKGKKEEQKLNGCLFFRLFNKRAGFSRCAKHGLMKSLSVDHLI